eukprot:CAMPEP_0174239722 /NCGR_PEP_ID=MMETSP0417-20130205/15823_1 /TAXON_ID=242541 /ORGANISM="Mayorella sp, Strain BSH-02190019" /LENGTH=330 /DNA_ID=CAMNT_0015318689 /DNA_START=11 /DNA_END=1003 /DNA_ORIENTATION=+
MSTAQRGEQRRRGGLDTGGATSTGQSSSSGATQPQQPVIEKLEDGTPELYALLGVQEQCTENELKRAYRKRALELHPDRNRDDPNAESRFHAAKEAYDRLRVAETRSEYDQQLVKLRARAAHNESRRADLKTLEKREQAHAQSTRQREQERTQYKHQMNLLRRESESLLAELHREEAERTRKHHENRKRKASQQASAVAGESRIVRAKWNPKKVSYDKVQLSHLLDPFGEIEFVIVKKRSALIGFVHADDARAAIEDVHLANSSNLTLTLKPVQADSSSSKRLHSPSEFKSEAMNTSADSKSTNFNMAADASVENMDDFEAEILRAMAQS